MNIKKLVRAAICLPLTLIKLSLKKLFYWKELKFHYLELFSPSSEVSVARGGGLHLGRLVRAQSGVRLRARKDSKLVIGDNTAFNIGCMVTCRHEIKIGKGVEFGPNVLIYDHDHDFRAEGGIKAKFYKYGTVEIGDNVWVGANTIILRGTKIGENSVIGAGSIVKGEFPANSVIVQNRETFIREISVKVN